MCFQTVPPVPVLPDDTDIYLWHIAILEAFQTMKETSTILKLQETCPLFTKKDFDTSTPNLKGLFLNGEG